MELGNSRELSPPVAPDLPQLNHPLLDAFRDRLQGDLSVVRFSSIRGLRSLHEGAAPIMFTEAGDVLVVERSIGRGRGCGRLWSSRWSGCGESTRW